MTVPTLQDYLDLIPAEHASQPDFTAALTAALQPFVDEQITLGDMPEEFDLDVAVGAQLDVVGQWVGLSRRLKAPITGVYFALDTGGVGLDQGVWLSPGDPIEGVISLDDETYRFFLRVKIAANNWDGTLSQAQQILGSIFQGSPGTLFFVQDNFDMSVTYGIAGTLPPQLLISLFAQGYISLRPAAVLENNIIVSTDGAPIFGLDANTPYISGLDLGAWAIPL